MKCTQCPRPAMFEYPGGVLLCLYCHKVLEDMRLKDILFAASISNQTLDDMDMVMGMRTTGGRVPIAPLAAALRGNVTNNHIIVKDANVGVINTGDLAKIEAVITITEGSDAEEIGLAIKKLAQAVVDSNELAADAKREIGELLAALVGEVAGKRSKPVMGAVIRGIDERVRSVAAIWSLWEGVAELISKLGSPTG